MIVLAVTDGSHRFVLSERGPITLGRDPSCEISLSDPAISRRHATLEISSDGSSVHITDLASRNGVWINGKRTASGELRSGDRLRIGALQFDVAFAESGQEDRAAGTSASAPFDAGRTIVRERPVPSREAAVAEIAENRENSTRRLTQLVGIAQRLGTFIDLAELLEAIAADLFTAFDADRVAILLSEQDGSLTTRVARDRAGSISRPVSRVIAEGVASRKTALMSNDAANDSLTAGESVVLQSVKSALAAPLLSEARETIGILYVDNLRARNAFTDDDLAFLVAFAGIAAAAVGRELNAERIQRAERARENLGRYFTPVLAERIATSTTPVSLGGSRQRVVVLFSDIRSFTAIAETMAPMAMAAQLNEYFGAMVECVFRHNGALDKFIGDALMAYWGAPEATGHDSASAIAAAIEMQTTLEDLNRRWSHEDRPQLGAGIGIHAGDAFVGNIGSPQRLEYTLIGDTVNIANRLCSLASSGEILVSESLVQSLPDKTRFRLRPELVVTRHTSDDSPVWEVAVSDESAA